MFNDHETARWQQFRQLPFSYRLLPMLGLRAGQHLPDTGVACTEVHPGVHVRIMPRDPNKSRKAHRTQAQCPTCKEWFCAGHLQQHFTSCSPE